MATSGSFNTTSTSYNDPAGTLTTYVKISWELVSAPVEENASYINVIGVLQSNMSNGYQRGYRGQTVTVNGTRAYYQAYTSSAPSNRYYGKGDTVFSISNFKIPHEADGTKSFTISYEAYVGNSSVNQTGSQSFTLDTIPRASSLAFNSSMSSIATSTATITRASSSFTHKLLYTYGGSTNVEWASFDASTTSKSLTVPTDIRTKMKANNAVTASVALTLQTFNGSTLIGSKSYTVSVSIPIASISASPASVSCDSNSTLAISNYDSTASTTTVERLYGNTVVYTDQSKGTATSLTKANGSFESYVINDTSGTVTVRITTYVGSTTVGSQTATYTVTIPTSKYKPSVTLSTAPSRTGTARGSVAFLAGYNGATMKFTESKVGHAAVSSRVVSVETANATETHSTSGTVTTVTTDTFPSSSSNYTVTIKMTVTDSRGVSASASTSISVTGYTLPTFSNVSAIRATSAGAVDTEGTYANITATATAHATAGSVTTVSLFYGTNTSISGTTTSASGASRTTYKNGYTYGDGLLTTREYTFTATATDALGLSSSITFRLPKAAVVLSLHKQGGMGINTTAVAGHIETPLTFVSSNSIPLHYRNSFGVFQVIEAKDGNDAYGIGVAFGSGGSTVVGAGESAHACLADISTPGTENLWLTADGTIYLCPNADTWSSRKTVSITYDGRILIPSTQFKITSESTITQIIISDVTYSEVVAQDSSLSSSRDDDRWFSALIKALCAKYPNRSNIRFIGQTSPNSLRNYEITIYNTSDLKSGLPRFSYGLIHNYGGSLDRFGTGEYSYYRNTGVHYAASAGSASNATYATDASNADVSSRLKTLRTNININDITAYTGTSTRTTVYEAESSAANRPADAYGYVVTMMGADTNYAAQLWIGETNELLYYRSYQGKSWKSWHQVEGYTTLWTGSMTAGSGATTINNMSSYRKARIYALVVSDQFIIWDVDLLNMDASTFRGVNHSVMNWISSPGAWYNTVLEVSMTKSQINFRNVYNLRADGTKHEVNQNGNTNYRIYRIDGIM